MDPNAITALKQIKMEVALDYGIHHEDIFDIMDGAENNEVLLKHLNRNKRVDDNN